MAPVDSVGRQPFELLSPHDKPPLAGGNRRVHFMAKGLEVLANPLLKPPPSKFLPVIKPLVEPSESACPRAQFERRR
jgi:hypothetical protein